MLKKRFEEKVCEFQKKNMAMILKNSTGLEVDIQDLSDPQMQIRIIQERVKKNMSMIACQASDIENLDSERYDDLVQKYNHNESLLNMQKKIPL